jgi:hypothetical protein
MPKDFPLLYVFTIQFDNKVENFTRKKDVEYHQNKNRRKFRFSGINRPKMELEGKSAFILMALGLKD